MQRHGVCTLHFQSHILCNGDACERRAFSFTILNDPSLQFLKNHDARTGYIGDFDIIDDHRSGKIVVQLNGRLNKTGVISPRFNVQVPQIESWVNLLLPARSFGKLILVSVTRERCT